MHYCFATGTQREGDDCRDCRGAVDETRDEMLYVLVGGINGRRPVAFGPFSSRDDAEYAAMDYYGTAITGASIKGEFLIAELRGAGDAPERAHARHVEALIVSDV